MSRRSPVEFALLSDVGRSRTHNEDFCAVDEANGLFVVCDGMGGAAGGEVASQLASRVFLDQARPQDDEESAAWRLDHAVIAANHAVFEQATARAKLRGMGTTLVALEVEDGNGKVWTANVGDSRCYRLRDRELCLLTEDHSYVDEQVRLGLLTPEQALRSPLRNIITRAVGSHDEVRPDMAAHDAHPGDLYLLCSDGLTRELEEEQIGALLIAGGQDLHACAASLVRMANESGGSDNITVILVRV
ncbi:Stp1/IreP family PP2C-type Ser/Thr phosphatase [Terriglobus roseus]|uniref:Protein phosphatase n=1 Tax=Terriglobus roseus TaxID=392734 RepID=A0A1H4L518_9BACT|nr:Stp1/IreP family PP2C-type Ser/Thr phosphatase [Terriglobus roseus]SEB65803.1 protein phosphatase [Terriglobus roseus]